MSKEYESFNHAKTYIRYHLIFSTKYRKNLLDFVSVDLTKIFHDISSISNFNIVETGIDGDHVHLLIKSCPSFSISQIVRRLKQVSTRRLWAIHEPYLRGHYWKKKPLWTNGYFCSTVGQISEDNALAYIRNQG